MDTLSSKTALDSLYSDEDLAAVDPARIPQHVAVVMDGNRRWANQNGEPIEVGHYQGAEQLNVIVQAAAQLGIQALTVYSFSTENWKRSTKEVELLMELLHTYLVGKRQELIDKGVCLHAIGNLDGLPQHLQDELQDTIEATQGGTRIDLILALNYGGRDELKRAMVKISRAVDHGELDWSAITEDTISSYLDTAPWPDPDLLIRPSGVQRISNFLIWQISYCEIVLTEVLWPDFTPHDLLRAVLEYQKRHRRFGG